VAIQFPMTLVQAAASFVPQARAAAAAADAAQAVQFRALVHAGTAAGAATDAAAQGVAQAQGAAQVQGVAQTQMPAPSVQNATPADEAAAGRSGSLGDAILRGLEGAREGLQRDWASVTSLVDPQTGPPSTQRLLQFQVGVLHVGFEQQMIAGVAAKTAQNIDQLVKMQ